MSQMSDESMIQIPKLQNSSVKIVKGSKVHMRPNTIVKNLNLKSKLSPINGIIRDKKNIPRRQVCKIYKTIGTNMKRKRIKWSNEGVSLHKGSIHTC